MNITPEMMYWMTRCDDVRCLGLLLAIASPIALCLFEAMAFYVGYKPTVKWIAGIVLSVLSLIGIVFATFVPTTREMAAIYVVPKIANSQTVKDLGEGVVTLAREWVEELRPAKMKGGAK